MSVKHKLITVHKDFVVCCCCFQIFVFYNYLEQLVDPQATDIDWDSLAQSFELTGGLIRNAVLSSISLASKTTPGDHSIKLTYNDLYNGAKLQLRYCIFIATVEPRPSYQWNPAPPISGTPLLLSVYSGTSE